MKILISACLLGIPCRYDGKSKPHPDITRLNAAHTLIPFCPEIYGGLSTPRPKAEICGEKVINQADVDVTEAYQKGAAEALRLVDLLQIDCALLKSKSPSCGIGQIYDGTFSGTFICGDGITAQKLKPHLPLFDETQIETLLSNETRE